MPRRRENKDAYCYALHGGVRGVKPDWRLDPYRDDWEDSQRRRLQMMEEYFEGFLRFCRPATSGECAAWARKHDERCETDYHSSDVHRLEDRSQLDDMPLTMQCSRWDAYMHDYLRWLSRLDVYVLETWAPEMKVPQAYGAGSMNLIVPSKWTDKVDPNLNYGHSHICYMATGTTQRCKED